jgi:hypothetical protein
MKHITLKGPRLATALIVGAALSVAMAYAGDAAVPAGAAQTGAALTPPASAPAPTRHQLMKECMIKERAADSGRPSYELTADCRNITKTEKQNADAQKKAQDTPAP